MSTLCILLLSILLTQILSFQLIRSLPGFRFSKLQVSNSPNDIMYEFITNDDNPKEQKKMVFDLWLQAEKAKKDALIQIEKSEKEKEKSEKDVLIEKSEKEKAKKDVLIEKSEKEKAMKDVLIQIEKSEKEKAKKDVLIQIEKSEKEKSQILSQVNTLTTDLEKSQSTLASFNPRALIEYVENWKMTDSKKLSRKDKWVKYLSSDDGKILFECIKSRNKMWGDSVDKVSAKIVEIYSTTSNVYHSTAHGLANGDNIIIERLANRIQEFNLSVCIASTYGIVWKEVP